MSLQGLHFIDIETVRGERIMEAAPKAIQDLYTKKFAKEIQDSDYIDTWAHYNEKAALYAEFGKVVCISIGGLHSDGKFYIRSIGGRHEKPLLESFAQKITDAKATKLIGHNIKEFDIPYLMRRCLAHGIKLPGFLNTFHLKPWETPYIDTMEMWSGTALRHRCGLDLLCAVLGIESPKSEMSGASVGDVFWGMFDGLEDNPEDLPFEVEEATLKKIGNYCAGDVLASAQVYCRMKGLPLIDTEKVVFL
jgi:predicted PolB exonuclease-like 3'-5' exonuclease